MHLPGAGAAHHLDDLHRGGAAHDRIVDQDDPLALDHGAVGVVLQAHAEMADMVGGLDEGAADIVVADDAELERHARLGGIADAPPARRNRAPARPRRPAPGFRAPSSDADALARLVDADALDLAVVVAPAKPRSRLTGGSSRSA